MRGASVGDVRLFVSWVSGRGKRRQERNRQAAAAAVGNGGMGEPRVNERRKNDPLKICNREGSRRVWAFRGRSDGEMKGRKRGRKEGRAHPCPAWTERFAGVFESMQCMASLQCDVDRQVHRQGGPEGSQDMSRLLTGKKIRRSTHVKHGAGREVLLYIGYYGVKQSIFLYDICTDTSHLTC